MTSFETLTPVITLLGCGIASVLLLPRIGLSPIVGFLVAGLLLGPHGMQLIPHNDTVALLAELGVVFLLFDIGLHFTLQHVWHERKSIFILGPLQVMLCAGLFYLIGIYALGLTPLVALILALALALSSTAVVSQVLEDRGLQGSPNSNTTLAILIFQDICAIFLLILAATVAAGEVDHLASDIGMALLKCIAAVGLALLIGQYLLKPLFKYVIRHNNSEVFTMIALFLVLLTGVATGAAGLSLTLGAFLAGMIIAETPFKHIIQTELRPFRFLLLSFFFITVGMTIDTEVLLADWIWVLVATVTLITVKIIAVFALFRAFRSKTLIAIQQAGLLFQGSEFLFVILASLSFSVGTFEARLASILIASVALSMALTAFIFDAMRKIAAKMLDQDDETKAEPLLNHQPHLVIIGMNEVGHTLALAMQHFGIPYLVVERDYQSFVKARTQGFPVIYGDRADIRFWEALGADTFKHVVITQPTIEVSKMYAPIVKERFPHLTRYASVTSDTELKEYSALGNVAVISLGIPPGLELAERILSDLNIAASEIELWVQEVQQMVLLQKQA